jgi:RNA polymerase sigma factor (sigma-70 family)
LINGIDKFDESKKVPFTAYAKQWIMAGITNPFNPVRQKSISSDAVGKDTNFSLTSIDSPVGNGTSDDKEMTVGDMIPDRSETADPGEMIDADETRTKLGIFLKKLTEKEAKAIRLRFSTKPDGTERTLEEIGDELGMTKMGAKMLIDRTITKLKQFARQEQIK